MNDAPIAAGKSSFSLIDETLFFEHLPLNGKTAVLDLACGNGAYSIAMAHRVEPGARIYAVDLWADGIRALEESIREKAISNICAIRSDVATIPLDSGAVDLCLAASVLHDLIEDETADGALQEMARVTGPSAELAVIEFRKIPGPPGPPEDIRLTPDALVRAVSPYGFSLINTRRIGPYHYLCRFRKTAP